MARNGHDIVIRYSQLLPEGVSVPDWAAARSYLAGLSDQVLAQHRGDSHLDVDDLSYELIRAGALNEDAETSGAEVMRLYLGQLLGQMEAEARNDRHGLPGDYAIRWKGRVGFVVDGYGFDEEPENTIPCRILRECGVLEAAGFELLP